MHPSWGERGSSTTPGGVYFDLLWSGLTERLASLNANQLSTSAYGDSPNRSPWVAQLAPDGPPEPLAADTAADVVVVGAGIAGVATAFFTLRSTSKSVLLLERDRVGRGASGHNAGQLTTYFERPLSDIAAEFGSRLAGEAQRGIDDAHDLLDIMVAEAAATVRVERFLGHMGMFNQHHLDVHLRSLLVRREEGLNRQTCVVSEDAEFLPTLPAAFAGLYTVVPQAEIRELLELDDDRYRAVLSAPAGCSNSGLLCQQVLAHLRVAYPDQFAYADHTNVERVVVDDETAVVHGGGYRVRTNRVVFCTNGFVDHHIEDNTGATLRLRRDQQIIGRVAHMTAFAEETPRTAASMSYIRNTVIGGETPYVYVTRRTYDSGRRCRHAHLHGRPGIPLPPVIRPRRTLPRRAPP